MAGYKSPLQDHLLSNSPDTPAGALPQPPPPPIPVSGKTTPPFTPDSRSTTFIVVSPVRAISTSPARPSLVSRRMHGPRLSGGGRRERPKYVGFDEWCDVVEFDREEETDEEMFDNASDREDEPHPEYKSNQDGDPFYHIQPSEQGSIPHPHELPYGLEHESLFESVQLSDKATDSRNSLSLDIPLNPDTDISRLVDETFSSSSNLTADTSPKVELQHMDGPIMNTTHQISGCDMIIPTDMDTIDGISFQRLFLSTPVPIHTTSNISPPTINLCLQ